VTGAGWNIHKKVEITDAGKGDTSSLPFINNVKEKIVFLRVGSV